MSRINRRTLLRAGAAAGLGAAAYGARRPSVAVSAPAGPAPLLDPLVQPKMRTPLPIMPYEVALGGGNLSHAVRPGIAHTGIVDAKGKALGTPIFGYEGIWPGLSLIHI